MNPLDQYASARLAEKLKSRKVVVWYDPRSEWALFARGLSAGAANGVSSVVDVAGVRAHLITYRGSFLEVRALSEPFMSGDEPEPTLIYVPGVERDAKHSLLMELELGGCTYERALKRTAREVLRARYTEGVIDELLAPEGLGYEDLARACSPDAEGTREPPSILRGIFPSESSGEAILATWLARTEHDAAIDAKGARPELAKLVRSRVGLDVPTDAPLSKMRAITLRYVLGGEFRADLRCPPPSALESVPPVRNKEDEAGLRDIARRLRTSHISDYERLAQEVENELRLARADISPAALGSIDTFRFEERALLRHCGDLIADGQHTQALEIIGERENSFWLTRDFSRKAQWEVCRRMAELGLIAAQVKADLANPPAKSAGWVAAYADRGPRAWYRLDQAQRRLETLVATVHDDPDERPLGVVRRAYEEACTTMAEGFVRALAGSHWAVDGVLAQTRVWSDVAEPRPRPVAYFMVDALRFEMGAELAERLPSAAEVSLRPAMAALPTITPIGMAALLPGAAASFSLATKDDKTAKLGASIEGVFMPDVVARRKHFAARVPASVDMTLDDLVGLTAAKLRKKIEGAQVIIVRSQEIDHAGEGGLNAQARRIMDSAIDHLTRAIKKLSAAGVEHAVVSADHGHLHFASDRDESLRVEAPGGDEVDLHRRCWVGRGGVTPAGGTRVSAAALGYTSDLDLVFPPACGVFKSGGDLAFHHGGPTLQELIVPVLTVRLKAPDGTQTAGASVSATGLQEKITNRIFSVVFTLGDENLSLFSRSLLVKPALLHNGRQVGAAGMALGADLDRATGHVKLEAGKPATIGFLLNDDTVRTLRVVLIDAATDAEIYKSAEIPVSFGV